MTVIDVRLREVIKDNYHKGTGRRKREFSSFEFKCKYYNPLSVGYSEVWISPECLIDISESLDVKDLTERVGKYYIYRLPNPKALEEGTHKQIATLLVMREIIFEHYKYTLIGEDIWTSTVVKIEGTVAQHLNEINIESLVAKKIPNTTTRSPLKTNDFIAGRLYEICYLSDQGISTNRTIFVTDKYTAKEKGNTIYFIQANCLLRHGQVRNFKLHNIKSSKALNKSFTKCFVEPLPPKKSSIK